MTLDSLQAPAFINYGIVKVKWKWSFSSLFEIYIYYTDNTQRKANFVNA